MAVNMLYRIEVRDVPQMTVGSIRGLVPVEPIAELDAWIAAAIHDLFRILAAQGIRPTGPPFAILPPPLGPEPVQIEVALPALRPVTGHGRVEGDMIPACRALATLHRGPYAELTGAYAALWRVIEEQKLETAGEPREVYLTNPLETPAEQCETEVLWPIVVPDDWELPERRVMRPLPRS